MAIGEIMSDFISDEDMKKLEENSTDSDFISDEDMKNLEESERVPSSIDLSQSIAPTVVGAKAGQLAQKGLEKAGERLQKIPEQLAEKLGGISPEQIQYYQQNYKDIESGKGISQGAVDDAFESFRQKFVAKNVAVNQARTAAEEVLQVPLTKELSEKAISQALPKVMTKIDPESEKFKNVLKERTTKTVESEVARLSDLLEKKKQLITDTSELAQNRAERAGEIAVKKANPKKKVGLVAEAPIDTKAIYNQAFDQELQRALPEQEQKMASLLKEYGDLRNKITDLSNEYYQSSELEPKIKESLIKEYQSPLAKKYATIEGFEDRKGLGRDVVSMGDTVSDVTSLNKKEAMDELRAARKRGWSSTSEVPQVSDEAAKAYYDELRYLLAPEGSQSDKALKEANHLLNQIKEAEQSGFIKRDVGQMVTGASELGEEDELINKFKPESVQVEKKQQDFLRKIMNPSKIDMQNPEIVESRQTLDKLVNDPEYLDWFKQQLIKADLIDEKKAFKFGPVDAFRIAMAGGVSALGGGLLPSLAAGSYEGSKYLKTPQGAYKVATMVPRILESKLGGAAVKAAKVATKSLPYLAGGAIGLAAQAAEEGFDAETSGATEDMPDYWLEKGVRDPWEQVQRARLSSFKEGLPNEGKSQIPSRFATPEQTKRYEDTLKAKKAGTLKENYVEKFESTELADIQNFVNFLQGSDDKASQEYSRVLSQLQDKPEREKSATLFALNQNPLFRQLAKKFKGVE